MNKFTNILKRHSGDILTVLSISGIITTIVLVAKESPKVSKIIEEKNQDKEHNTKEIIKEVLPSALPIINPSIITGSATIACIISANVLNRRKQASLVSAYTLISTYHNNYKNKLKELYGEEAHNNIIDSLAIEKAKDTPIIVPGIAGSSCLDFGDEALNETRLFYDVFSGRYFESTIFKVLQAEYHLNRNFCLSGHLPANEFYNFLGIEPLENGDKIGWSWEDGLYWIDFNHDKTTLEDGLEVYTIDLEWIPTVIMED